MDPPTATMLAAFLSRTLTLILKETTEKLKSMGVDGFEFINQELELIAAAIADYRYQGIDSNLLKTHIKHLACLAYEIEDFIDGYRRHHGLEEMKVKRFFSLRKWKREIRAVWKVKALKKKAEKGRKRWQSYVEVRQNQQPAEGCASSSNSVAAQDCPVVKDIRSRLGSLLSHFIVIDDMASETIDWKTNQVDSKLLANEYRSEPDRADCMLYFCSPHFCMFPVGHRVSRNSLVRRWQAEGLILDKDEVRSAHGMMHRYMSQVLPTGRYAMCHNETPTPHIRRVSVHRYRGGKISASGGLAGLRTLAVFPMKDGGRGSAAVDPKVNFSQHKMLRVLDLEECDGLDNSHLERICRVLLLLKYLSLGGTITEVPSEIKRLKWLETLDLRRSSCPVVTVRAEAVKLPRLKHLLGKFQLPEDDARALETFLQDEEAQECMLETAAGFVINNNTGFLQLMAHMNRLKKVKIWCESTADGENLARHTEAIKNFGDIKSSMPDRSLSVELSKCEDPDAFLHSLHDGHRSMALDSVKLSGNLSRFPRFVAELAGISTLCLSSTNLRWGEHIAGAVRKLCVLKYLKLVGHDRDDPIHIKHDTSQSLERLCLLAEQGLPLIEIEGGALPRLISLRLLSEGPVDLTRIGITHLQTLKEVALNSGAAQETKEKWAEQAKLHPNNPKLVFIQKPQTSAWSQSSSEQENIVS